MSLMSTGMHRATRLRCQLAQRLLELQGPDLLWRGHLSDSALATAVAILALSRAGHPEDQSRIARALQWLTTHTNSDGGWGDCPSAPSNLTATLLVRAALDVLHPGHPAVRLADRWIQEQIGALSSPDAIVAAILHTYGNDRTFSVPILAVCAATGQLGEHAAGWARVPPLPFELGILPHRILAVLRLPVVSYALPALIALGWAQYRRVGATCAPFRRLRSAIAPAALRRLQHLQPTGGGFLEAVPLTAFVVIALLEGGAANHVVIPRALAFLRELQRPNGAWPIDRDLSLWLSHQAAAFLAGADPRGELWPPAARTAFCERSLHCQWSQPHPFTGAAPGGWAWTDHDGGVPDADDTSAALLALAALAAGDPRARPAAEAGVRWLLNIQNDDGGVPTFCRGWNRLPFDKSCPDITAHALRACSAWASRVSPPLQCRIARARRSMARYLAATQNVDGTWQPLWFGNPCTPDGSNRTLGTSMVLTAFACPDLAMSFSDVRKRALSWLLSAQGATGGWGAEPGGEPTIEETSAALAAAALAPETPNSTLERGLEWLEQRWADSATTPIAAPIGLYFARLWYAEDLYPLLWSLRAAVVLTERFRAEPSS